MPCGNTDCFCGRKEDCRGSRGYLNTNSLFNTLSLVLSIAKITVGGTAPPRWCRSGLSREKGEGDGLAAGDSRKVPAARLFVVRIEVRSPLLLAAY